MKRFLLGLMALFLPAAQAAPQTAPEAASEQAAPAVVHSYVLLDRTGSMRPIWAEALSSVNAYADGLATEQPGDEPLETRLTLAVFDAQDGLQFDVLREGVGAGEWSPVTEAEANPRGMTPLFDAIGRLMALAEKDAPERAVIVIMTDGEENASRELDRTAARAALDKARERGWEVVFLGAEFASFDDADAVGVDARQSMAVSKDQLDDTMSRLATKTRNYGQKPEAPVEFDAEDRAVAEEDAVKDRQK